jgi:putative spermidine/putrescine transport system permease protein
MTSRLPAIVVLGLLVTFLVGPFVGIVAASLSAGDTLAFPPQGFSLRCVAKVFAEQSFRSSFALSMFLAIFSRRWRWAVMSACRYGSPSPQ